MTLCPEEYHPNTFCEQEYVPGYSTIPSGSLSRQLLTYLEEQNAFDEQMTNVWMFKFDKDCTILCQSVARVWLANVKIFPIKLIWHRYLNAQMNIRVTTLNMSGVKLMQWCLVWMDITVN